MEHTDYVNVLAQMFVYTWVAFSVVMVSIIVCAGLGWLYCEIKGNIDQNSRNRKRYKDAIELDRGIRERWYPKENI